MALDCTIDDAEKGTTNSTHDTILTPALARDLFQHCVAFGQVGQSPRSFSKNIGYRPSEKRYNREQSSQPKNVSEELGGISAELRATSVVPDSAIGYDDKNPRGVWVPNVDAAVASLVASASNKASSSSGAVQTVKRSRGSEKRQRPESITFKIFSDWCLRNTPWLGKTLEAFIRVGCLSGVTWTGSLYTSPSPSSPSSVLNR